MPQPKKNKNKKAYLRKGNRFVTFSTLLPTLSSESSPSATIVSSAMTSPAMLANTNDGYLGIEPNRSRNQSQQDFANAS